MSDHHTYLAVKALKRDDGRWIEGWATTGREDRMGDIVVPEGAKYSLPIPLLFAHKHDEPIGSVVRAEVTRAGIRIRAKLTEGVARAEEVWTLLQDGALTAVSIGFQALKHSALPTGGLRFDSWEWHELSVVSVPANPDARISVAKCIAHSTKDTEPFSLPASSGGKIGKMDAKKLADVICEGLYPTLDRIHNRIKTLEQQAASGGPASFDPELFGEGVGKAINNRIAPLLERVDTLEKELAQRKGMAFMGEFQSALSYPAGAVVRQGDGLFLSLRSIEPGKAPPQRQGGGWERIV